MESQNEVKGTGFSQFWAYLEETRQSSAEAEEYDKLINKLQAHPLYDVFPPSGEVGHQGASNVPVMHGLEEAFPWVYDLATCKDQGGVCRILALANGGVVDLRRAEPLIRRLGLAQTTNAGALIKNLGHRLLKSGLWVSEGNYCYRLRDFRPPEAGHVIGEPHTNGGEDDLDIVEQGDGEAERPVAEAPAEGLCGISLSGESDDKSEAVQMGGGKDVI